MIVAHPAGNMRGRETCGDYASLHTRHERLRVLVNGNEIADTVDARTPARAAESPLTKRWGWNSVPIAGYKADSVSVGIAHDSLRNVKNAGRRKTSSTSKTAAPSKIAAPNKTSAPNKPSSSSKKSSARRVNAQ